MDNPEKLAIFGIPKTPDEDKKKQQQKHNTENQNELTT